MSVKPARILDMVVLRVDEGGNEGSIKVVLICGEAAVKHQIKNFRKSRERARAGLSKLKGRPERFSFDGALSSCSTNMTYQEPPLR